MKAGPIGIILLAVIGFLGLSSFFVLNEREQAIVLRFGEIKDVKTEPGLYFKMPLTPFGLDTVQIIEDRLIRYDLNDLKVQVSDGKFYLVDAFLTYRVKDASTFRRQVSGNIQLAERRLKTRFDSSIRSVYGLRGFEAALSEERSAMMVEVRDALRVPASEIGLEIADVRITRTDLTEEVSGQTFERMNAERFAEAERLRARGSEAARRLKAKADREVVEIKAAAQRDAEILRGEGEGERNAIFANAFNRDAEFFEFYRSMISYGESLKGAGTTMVLSPNSDFFRYFNDPMGAAKTAPKQ